MFIFGPIQRLLYPGLLNPALTGIIRNRVQDIHDLLSSSAWRHCPGIQNPADLQSRGIKLDQLKESKLYWHGPEWLILEESCWPAQDVACMLTPESVEEMKNEEVKTK